MHQRFAAFDKSGFLNGMIAALIGGYGGGDILSHLMGGIQPSSLFLFYMIIVAVVLGFGIVAIFRAVLSRPVLELNKGGFLLRHGRLTVRHGWNECTPFFMADVPGRLGIGRRRRVACDVWRPSQAQEAQRQKFGAHVVLLPDLGASTDALLDVMNEFRETAQEAG